MFFTQGKLLVNFDAAQSTNTYEKWIQALANLPLLIIEDFGPKLLKSIQYEDLHNLIDDRDEQHAYRLL